MLPKTTDGLPSDSADCHQQENAVGERSQDGAATQSVGVPDTGSALSQDGGSPSQEKAQDVTQVMARIRNQSQRVRGQTKHHLGEHIDNVQRYADGKSFTESRRQVVRMLRTTVRTMTVRIFSCRMTRRTPAVAVAVARSLACFSSQRRIRIFHRSRKIVVAETGCRSPRITRKRHPITPKDFGAAFLRSVIYRSRPPKQRYFTSRNSSIP